MDTLPVNSASKIAKSGWPSPIDSVMLAMLVDQNSAIMRGLSGKKGSLPNDKRLVPHLTGENAARNDKFAALKANFMKNRDQYD